MERSIIDVIKEAMNNPYSRVEVYNRDGDTADIEYIASNDRFTIFFGYPDGEQGPGTNEFPWKTKKQIIDIFRK